MAQLGEMTDRKYKSYIELLLDEQFASHSYFLAAAHFGPDKPAPWAVLEGTLD